MDTVNGIVKASAWRRIVTSSKVRIAFFAFVGTLITAYATDPDKWVPIMGALNGLAAVVIAAIAYEDGQQKSNPSNMTVTLESDPSTQPSTVPLLLISLLAMSVSACAPIAPGQDKALVQAERSTASAFEVVDSFLLAEHTYRDQIREDFPDVHVFAELLRSSETKQLFRDTYESIDLYRDLRTEWARQDMESKAQAVSDLARNARLAIQKIRTHYTTDPPE